MTSEIKASSSRFKVGVWEDNSISQIYSKLEIPNWAPWLVASQDSLAGRARIFKNGQLVLMEANTNIPAASLSTNRIWWNGDPKTLPSWDTVAGDPTTYEATYQPNGNTMTLMSMNVRPDLTGAGLARKLIEEIQMVARELAVENLIGSFRPTEYGKYKLNTEFPVDFGTYCSLTRPDGLPIDSWIRNLTRNGMIPLRVDPCAMVVQLPLQEFNELKNTFNVDKWHYINDLWECGEVGNWTVDKTTNLATYIESNLWGKLRF